MSEKPTGKDALTPNEISAFCTQIAMVMKAGIPVSEGVEIMMEDMKNPAAKDILEKMHKCVELGSPLYLALEETGRFPKYVVDMCQIGEATGKLDDVMESLAAYYDREEAIAKNIKNAVTYPLIMIGMMLFVIAVLIIRVMPIFNDVFVQLGSEMTGFSRSVLNLGRMLGSYSFVFVGVVAVCAIGYFLLRGTEEGRRILQRWGASFFATKKLNAKIASGRFAAAMALMMASGLDTDQALDMVYRLVDNEYVRKKITACKQYISEGFTFADSLVRAAVFSGIYARMVAVGFKTGAADMVMHKLAERYEEEIDTQIGNIISVLEPTLVAILSIVVGMILLSVMLPLMGIMSSIG